MNNLYKRMFQMWGSILLPSAVRYATNLEYMLYEKSIYKKSTLVHYGKHATEGDC